MPRLRRADAHHRDLPTWRDPAIPRTTQKGRRMTKRTSTFCSHSLNYIAFRAGIGLHKRGLTTQGAIEIETRLCAKQDPAHKFTAQDTKYQCLGVPSAGLTSRFPIEPTQTPRLPPSHVFQRGPPSHQNENLRSGPHRKTLNNAVFGPNLANDCF